MNSTRADLSADPRTLHPDDTASWQAADAALSRAIDRATCQLRYAQQMGDDAQARAWVRVLRDLEAKIPPPVEAQTDGWLLVPLDLGPDGPAIIAVRDR